MFSSSLLFLDIGGGELILILFVFLMLFGGKKLPELARGLGKGIRDFKDASEGVKREINNQIDILEAKKAQDAANKNTITPPEDATGTPPADDAVPVAEIQSGEKIASVNEEATANKQTGHLGETPLEHAAIPGETREEHKS